MSGRWLPVVSALLVARVAVGAPAPSSSAPKPAPSVAPKPAASAAPKPAASAKPKPAPTAKPAPSATVPSPGTVPKPTSPIVVKPIPPQNLAAQKSIAGGPASGASLGAESKELEALREAEVDMFGVGAAPGPGSPWPLDVPAAPKSDTGGLPPLPAVNAPIVAGKSHAWLATLKLPDLPTRWDHRVVTYLEFFRDDPRGKKLAAFMVRRSGRYKELIQEQLRARGMPEDLCWLAMAESAFDPGVKSPAGALGLFQFMPETGKIYGLSLDRWGDGRLSPIRATEAGITHLSDLKKRFGTWELAMAAYNMGYGGVLAAVKRFNTNDYWELSRLEYGLPWETTLYVPKIIAIAVMMRNLPAFGLDEIARDASLGGDRVDVPAGAELKSVASAAGISVKELEQLNPELKAGRTPPVEGKATTADEPAYTVVVPKGRGPAVKDAWAKLGPKGNALEKYVLRFGETLDQVAVVRKVPKAKLVELNGVGKDEVLRAGTVLLVPAMPPGAVPMPTTPYGSETPLALVPGKSFTYADRKRVFYKVLTADSPREIADAFQVSLDDLATWNSLDPTARLQEGMWLQIYAPKAANLGKVVFAEASAVKILVVGSDEFYDLEEGKKGRKRLTVHAVGGETVEALGKKHGVAATLMERINRRPRNDILKKGEPVIVYVPKGTATPGAAPSMIPPPDAKHEDEDPK
ncbi:MAG: transglycosylase SLT domain-containing protein [Myxococcales bacterium]|nr:transglycosylase SLT domain-containing protein [Myxococcales bacterium]